MSPNSDTVLSSALPFQPDKETADPARDQESVCILLVEDNPGDVGLVREALNEHQVQCELTVITDGERAIRYIDDVDAGETPCPQLVILDLNLPKRPGREVLEHMRASARCSRSPVVILSSSDGRKDREEAAKLGATRYLKKPSRLDDFMSLGAVFKEILAGRTQ